uniref:Uncharacterized protein n=1 Tax=Nelumbo nucifera TaxID=4432 RepID=A0A822YKP4_NELNU|nr:TPA_asm: hypothetical protein HUJ06_011524 [Nelumbo nucifera]
MEDMSSTTPVLATNKRPSKKKRRANDSTHMLLVGHGSVEGRSASSRSAEHEVVYINPSYNMPSLATRTSMPHTPPKLVAGSSNSHAPPEPATWSRVSTSNRIRDPYVALQLGKGILLPKDVYNLIEQDSTNIDTKMIWTIL